MYALSKSATNKDAAFPTGASSLKAWERDFEPHSCALREDDQRRPMKFRGVVTGIDQNLNCEPSAEGSAVVMPCIRASKAANDWPVTRLPR